MPSPLQKDNRLRTEDDGLTPRCYTIGSLIFNVLNQEALITDVIDNAFSLSRCDATTFDVTLKGTIQTDDAYLESMPAFIRNQFENALGDDPLLIEGPDNEIVVIARIENCSSYSFSVPPYNRIDLYCQKLSHEPAPLLFQTVLLPMISELLAMQDSLLMHAGSVATPEGDGILLIADSGGGKTTTTLTMAMAGFKYISDDMVVVSKTAEGLIIRPVREKMNLTRKTINFFPKTAYLREAIEKSPDNKIPVDPADLLAADQIADQAYARAVFLMKVGGKVPSLIPQSANAILAPMIKNSNFTRRKALSKQKIDLLWELLDQSQCFRLETGLEPKQLGGWLRNQAVKGTFCPPSQVLKSDIDNVDTMKVLKPKRINPKRFTAMASSGLKPFLHHLLAYTLDRRSENSGYMQHFFSTVDHQLFHRWIRHHRMEAHVAAYILDHSQAGESLSLSVEEILLQAKAQALHQASMAGRFCDALKANDISVLMVRGPAMAEAIFPEPFLRYCRDIDMVVSPADLERAETVVKSFGFYVLEEREEWLEKGELPLTDGRVVVELHWQVYPANIPMPGLESDAWEQTHSVKLDGFPVEIPAPEHLILSACLHLVCEHWMDRVVRLIDMRQILNRFGEDLDWDWVIERTLKANMRFPVGHALAIAKEIVGAPVPLGVLRQLAPITGLEKIASNLISSSKFIRQPMEVSRLRRFIYRMLVQQTTRQKSRNA